MDAAALGTGTGFAVLGPLDVRRAGRPVPIGGVRLRALATLLALRAGHTVSMDVLVGAVWPDGPPTGAANALQALVSRLRAVLGRDLVVAGPAGYRLTAEPGQVDAHRFTRLAAEGRLALRKGDADHAATALRDALALWRGPALADLPGCPGEIARLEELRLAAVEDRIDADLGRGRPDDALADLPALIAAHPLRERLRGLHMRALYGAGRQVEALAAYQEARADFADRLGADPSPELADLHVALLRQEAPRPARGNLRARLTSFVGRDTEVAEVRRLLERHRLVTLTGPGGSGKTRLAVESAEGIFAPDGVWLAELAQVRLPEEVAPAVLTALGLRDAAGKRAGTAPEDPVERLAEALAGWRALLVLDNCEHVIGAAAALAERLLTSCPGIRVLATSREPLAIGGERLQPVHPLGPDHAVRLFADRAAASRPGFRLAEDRAAVDRICRELDGLPLAIELAAARLRTLPAAQLADRLDDRFRVLTGGSRTALPRQRTLRAVVEWSWDLLDPAEARLAARLAVFAGGATLGAAEAVCAGELDVLGRLVDKSLVGFDGERYRMLETIRAYAAERLAAAGEEHAFRLAHARYFTELAERAEPRLRDGEQVAWLATLSGEHGNLLAALRFTTTEDSGELALRLAGALGWYWCLVGFRAEAAHWLAAADRLGERDPGADPGQVALVLAARGLLMINGGADRAAAAGCLDRAVTLAERRLARPWHPLVALARPLAALLTGLERVDEAAFARAAAHPDPWVAGTAALLRCQALFNLGEIDEAEAALRRALERYRETGDRWGMGNALAGLGEILSLRGEVAAAVPVMGEAVRLVDEIGILEDIPYIRTRLAVVLHTCGDQAGALRALAEADRVSAAVGDPSGAAAIRCVRGDLAREAGDLAAAGRHYAEATRLLADPLRSAPQFQAMIRTSLGLLAEQRGQLPAARRLLGEALELALLGRDGPIIAEAVVGLAGVALREGDPARAARLLGAAATLRGVPVVVGFDHIRVDTAARAALGPGEFGQWYDQGRALTRDEATALLGAVTEGPDGERCAERRDPGRPQQ
ncbi:BTAD domain-containing putative transcriptional regulator [Acrocarpospora catenulata]|uniref:BTAD domain-containing putative transcriptional regulator n=1 Tax=Acrocarpospora catenulata TaxID=2836182 RepID=UPI001BDAD36D|nr:BTAD domain-containing putative transcriptional regulator [Acrocarpospora catenulata]